MARCGCNNAMSSTCEAVMSCVAANLGPGLDYNETTRQIDLEISGDAGNIVTIGSDDGLFVPDGDVGPGAMVWLKTVATLPEEAIAASSGSSLVGPSTSQALLEYDIANGIDIYSVPVHGLADGTVMEQLGAGNTSVTTFTDNPGVINNRELSSLTLQQLHYDAGTRVNSTGRQSLAPAALLTPDGGWGGFYAPVFKPRTVDEMLRDIRGRMVVSIVVQRTGLTEAQIESDIIDTVEAVVAAGAQDWVMILVPSQFDDNSRTPIDDWVAIVTDAGITAGVDAKAETSMPSPFTPAEIVASGATWVAVVSQSRPDGVTDARISALVAAPLEVEVTTTARQFWTTHAFGLGARAVRSPDAVYARGVRGESGDLNYRQPLVPGLATETTTTGGLTPVTDTSLAMWNAGFARTDLPGRWFPEQYAWSGATPMIRNGPLIGTICPYPDTASYTIRIRVRREVFPINPTSNRFAALFFAVPDDRGVHHLSGSGVSATADGYIAMINSRTVGTTLQLQTVTNGTATSLGTITSGAVTWTADTWITLEVTVNGANISFSATNATTTETINAVNSDWRGAYAFHIWDDQLGAMVHGFDNPTNLVMYDPT